MMKGLVDNKLLSEIVRKTVSNVLREAYEVEDDGFETKLQIGKREHINHTERAFTIGDKILYWRRVPNKRITRLYGKIVKIEEDAIFVDENGTLAKIPNDGRILQNKSWMLPLKHFLNGSDEIPQRSYPYLIDYERGTNGKLFVTIEDKKKNQKYFYNHYDGSYVAKTSTDMREDTKWAIMRGKPYPVRIIPDKAIGYWYIVPESLFEKGTNNRFNGWILKKYNEIVKHFPWLYSTPSLWKGEKSNQPRMWCPSKLKNKKK